MMSIAAHIVGTRLVAVRKTVAAAIQTVSDLAQTESLYNRNAQSNAFLFSKAFLPVSERLLLTGSCFART
jgi:hypothetical protein